MRAVPIIVLSLLALCFSTCLLATADEPDGRSVDALVAALGDRDGKVRANALQSLSGRSAPPSVDASPDPVGLRNRRPWADKKRLAVTEAGAVPLLIAILKTGAASEVERGRDPGPPAWRAAEVLGRIKARQAVEPLIAALGSKDEDTCALSAWALGEIGDDRALEPLFTSLDRSAKRGGNRHNWWVYDALAKLGRPAVRLLISKLKNGSTADRKKAVEALGSRIIRDKSAIDPLTSALKDSEPGIRATAAQALSGYDDVKSGKPLVALLGDPSPPVRAAAAEALGRQRYGPALDKLLSLLKDGDLQVRQNAVTALSCLKDRRALKPLIGMLKDQNTEVRRRAVWGLGWLGDTGAIEPLLSLLPDGDEPTRSAVADSLGYAGDERAVEPVLALLKDSSPRVRANAAGSLGRLRDARASKPLIAAMQESEIQLRMNAAWALGEIADPVATAYLKGAMERRELQTVERAHAFFIRQGDTDTIPILIEALNKGGSGSTAIDYVMCGNPELEKAGRDYLAEKHAEYELGQGKLRQPVWGSARELSK